MFFVSTMWRGTLRIGDMRIFPTEEAAWQYANTLNDTIRVYELSDTEYPRMCKPPKDS
jgi:hypothetical protein